MLKRLVLTTVTAGAVVFAGGGCKKKAEEVEAPAEEAPAAEGEAKPAKVSEAEDKPVAEKPGAKDEGAATEAPSEGKKKVGEAGKPGSELPVRPLVTRTETPVAKPGEPVKVAEAAKPHDAAARAAAGAEPVLPPSMPAPIVGARPGEPVPVRPGPLGRPTGEPAHPGAAAGDHRGPDEALPPADPTRAGAPDAPADPGRPLRQPPRLGRDGMPPAPRAGAEAGLPEPAERAHPAEIRGPSVAPIVPGTVKPNAELFLTREELIEVLALKGPLDVHALAGTGSEDAYDGVFWGTPDGQKLYVGVQIWRPRSQADAQRRYATMVRSYPNAEETQAITAKTFLAYWNDLYYLVFFDPLKQNTIVGITCDRKACDSPQKLLDLALKIKAHLDVI